MTTHRLSRGRAALVAIVALGMAAAACGQTAAAEDEPTVAALTDDQQSPPEDPASQPPDGDDEVTEEEAEAAQIRYDQCLADQGLDLDELFGDVDASEEGGAAIQIEVDDEAEFDSMMEDFDEANEICMPILEEVFGSFEMSPEDEAAFNDAQAAFTQCMADAGFDVAADDAGDGAFGFEISADDTSADGAGALDAALEECDTVMQEVLEDQGIQFEADTLSGADGNDS